MKERTVLRSRAKKVVSSNEATNDEGKSRKWPIEKYKKKKNRKTVSKKEKKKHLVYTICEKEEKM